MLTIRYFKAYSKQGLELEDMLKKSLISFLKTELDIEAKLEVCDSKGLSQGVNNAPWNVLTSAFSNSIVIIDCSIEEVEGYRIGCNFECITSAVSSLDNILVVSRTQLPLNFIPCRTNVAPLGEIDRLNPENNVSGYSKQYTNAHILDWLYQQVSLMKDNGRIPRPKNLLIDVNFLSATEILEAEKYVLRENLEAIKAEQHQKKKIFISYRTKYFIDGDESNEEVLQASKYKGLYNINDVVNVIKEYHLQKGDLEDWANPIYYPKGILSNECMPENRRWAFVSIPDRKIRECDEFWIFDTNHKVDENGKIEEVGYWDSWWCLGEFLTLVRMNFLGQLKDDFKIMIFSPDNESMVTELSHDRLPKMTEAQNRELARYFANGDFLEAGLESMVNMRKKRHWPKFSRKLYFFFMKRFVWPHIFGGFRNYPYKYFEESVMSHVYDKSFIQNRILECGHCKKTGACMNDILDDNMFVWNFLNINGYYSNKIPNIRKYSGIINISGSDMNNYIQEDGDYIVTCKSGHKIKIRKSSDKFYIFWQPKNGRPTGPCNSIIETVDLYEII
ncbi:MAG: hypothetical protein NC453_27880 [Muribaculum sp.]|nr:hypothetical protein [Muribaculum sp.]